MNNSQDPSKRARIFGKVIALALLIFSLYCFWGVWIRVLKGYFKEGFEPFGIMFLFVFLIPFSIFAGYCLVVARRSYKGLTKESLRNVCFISSLIVYIMLGAIAASVLEMERSTSKGSMWFSLRNVLCMIPAGLFYWLTNKYLTRWLGFDTSIDWQRRKKAAKHFFGLMAFLIWGTFVDIARGLEETSDIGSPFWAFGILLLPITVVFIFYKLSLRIAMHGCPRNQDQTSEVAEDNLLVR